MMKNRGIDALVNDCLIGVCLYYSPMYRYMMLAANKSIARLDNGVNVRSLHLRLPSLPLPAIHQTRIQ